MDNVETLLCREDVVVSALSEHTRTLSNYSAQERTNITHKNVFKFPLDDNEAVACLQEKESRYMPGEGYFSALHLQDLCHARSTAVQWILKVPKSYSFGPPTIALAVNYFDQYLSKHLSKSWKAWMIELLSVACLSIAAKMEEVNVPLLLDLQIDGLQQYVFDAKTIQRMELAVLSSLNWRMSSVTVFSYVDELILRLEVNGHLRNSLLTRVTELLLGSLSVKEVAPLQAETLNNALVNCFPLLNVSLEKCSRLMEELVVDPAWFLISCSRIFDTPTSPATMAEVPDKDKPVLRMRFLPSDV